MSLTQRDRKRLAGVNADLVRVVELAAESFPLMVVEGVRAPERQAALYAQGRNGNPGPIVTWSMNSKHLTGNAVDVAPVPLDWKDKRAFLALAGAMHAAAQKVGIRLRHGGDWDMDGITGERGESDWPHFEIV